MFCSLFREGVLEKNATHRKPFTHTTTTAQKTAPGWNSNPEFTCFPIRSRHACICSKNFLGSAAEFFLSKIAIRLREQITVLVVHLRSVCTAVHETNLRVIHRDPVDTLACGCGGDRVTRRNAIRDVVFSAANDRADLAAVLEKARSLNALRSRRRGPSPRSGPA